MQRGMQYAAAASALLISSDMNMSIRIRRACLHALAAINKISAGTGKLNATTAAVLLDHSTTNHLSIFPPSN